MTSGFDLDAYLGRIRYAGPRSATLDTLSEILLNHAQTVPFENLNPLLRWPVRLDARSLQQKLVHDGRGGYCFEHNLLLGHALSALGFHITGLAARVLWNVPAGAITARGHMLLLVDLNDRAYIADVGFGGQTLTAPLRLEPGLEQSTPHEPFRLMRQAESFVLETKVRGLWQPLYRFDLQEQFLSDYEVANWYLSTHPESHFVKGLIAARPDADRRSALRNNELTIHHLSGATERHQLTTVAQLEQALTHVFRIVLPDAPELRSALDRLVARAA
jgi:N-hydroxyarylamine O-acetyltransferase